MEFCYLEHDEKNYILICRFLTCTTKDDFFRLGNELQRMEIEDHVRRHPSSSAHEWIRENAVKYRSYLNSLTELCFLLKAWRVRKDTVSVDIVNRAIDFFDNNRFLLNNIH